MAASQIRCPECEGRRWVYTGKLDRHGNREKKMCPTCDAKGVILVEAA